MYKITNCVNDRSKEHLRRSAPGFIMEPSVGGVRIRMGESINLSDAHFEQNRKLLEGWERKGIVTIEKVGGAPAPKSAEPPPPPAPPPTTTEDPGAGASTAEMTSDASSEAKTEESAPAEATKKGSGKKKLF